jgi:hypothetical protein
MAARTTLDTSLRGLDRLMQQHHVIFSGPIFGSDALVLG